MEGLTLLVLVVAEGRYRLGSLRYLLLGSIRTIVKLNLNKWLNTLVR